MASPQEYRDKFNKLDFKSYGTEGVTSSSRLLEIRRRVGDLEDALWKLKKGIKSEINLIWDQYREESKDSIGDSLASVFLGRKTSNKIRKLTRSHLIAERDQLILAYREVEAMIDDALNRVNKYRNSLKDYAEAISIEEEKQEKARKQEQFEKQILAESRRQQTGRSPHYLEYIKSKEWRLKAEEAKARAGNRCQVCNRSRAEVQLDAHHRTYERLGHELPGDITVLCRDCHQLYEDEKKAEITRAEESTKAGFCIRCKQAINLNPQVPYCDSCFKIWGKYKNTNYREEYCHICGNVEKSTFTKPACYQCYKKNRHVLQFPEI